MTYNVFSGTLNPAQFNSDRVLLHRYRLVQVIGRNEVAGAKLICVKCCEQCKAIERPIDGRLTTLARWRKSNN